MTRLLLLLVFSIVIYTTVSHCTWLRHLELDVDNIYALNITGLFRQGVMALSVAAFTFWIILAPTVFPAIVPAGGLLLHEL